MGGNFIGVFAFYIASPLSFLTLFFPVSKMPVAIELLTILKIGLCSLTFSMYAGYLSEKYQGRLKFSILIPSVCYAFMSYTMVYSLSIMWLDGVIMLPLILMGVEKIFDGKKGLWYVISLTIIFYSNYYVGYMIGLFTGIYFIIRMICEYTKGNMKTGWIHIKSFVVSTLLSVAMASPLLICVFKDLFTGKLSNLDVYTGYEPDTSTIFEFKLLFTKLLHGKYDSITYVGLPSIYCGFTMMVLAVAFLLLRQIKWREKIGFFLALCLLAASFYYVKFDELWHGFQYPNWFPFRHAFLFSFVIVYMALRAMIVLSTRKWIMKMNKAVSYVVTGILIIAVSIDMGTNGNAMIQGLGNEFGYGEMQEYDQFIQKTQPLVEKIKKSDSGLYRINQKYEYSKNDALLLGYNGMTHYSSAFNANINSLTPRLGLGQSYFWNSGYGSTPLIDSIFGCKYTIHDGAMPQCYKALDNTPEGAVSYENTMTLPFLYAVGQECTAGDLNQQSVFVNQNNYLAGITGQENNYFTGETSGALYLGEYKTGDTLYIQVVCSQDGNTYSPSYTEIVQMNINELQDTMSSLKKGGLRITDSHGGHISGTITLQKDQKEIMTSIPYDKGWTLRVDGKKVKYADTFIQFPCSSGQHKITMQYVAPGFYTGLLVGVIGFLLALVFVLDKAQVFVKWDYIIANTVAFILSVLWSLYWNNKLVFDMEGTSWKDLLKALLKMYVTYAFTGIVLNNILSYLWIDVLHISKFIAPLINSLIGVPINFVLNKFWAFQGK